MQWMALIISLPTKYATARMRVWRALKLLGCGVPRDGVYLLPAGDAASAALQTQAEEVRRAKGSAYVVDMRGLDAAENARFASLFDRTDDYAVLTEKALSLNRSLPSMDAPAIRRNLKNLQRDMTALTQIDFFPGEAQAQAHQTVAEVEALAASLLAPNEPQAIDAEIAALEARDYQKRLWATRADMWIDRVASAWLIRRFIDARARFLWLDKPSDCPPQALGFDFDGAQFTHVGARVTFEVLLASFALRDIALERIAASIHYLDVGGIPVEDAAGLETILRGIKQRFPDDDRFLKHASDLFDNLYISYTPETK